MERIIGGVGVVDKTVAILTELSGGPLSLAELTVRTGIAKPTVHRLCSALEAHGVIQREGTDRRRLGPRIEDWFIARHSSRQTLVEVSMPVLRRLRDETGESVQLYVREGDQRLCVAGLESPHDLRTIVRVGAIFPLELGSAGKILQGEPLGRRRWVQSIEERQKGVASVSAPIARDDHIEAAVSVSGPLERTGRQPGRKYGVAVATAAEEIAFLL